MTRHVFAALAFGTAAVLVAPILMERFNLTL